MNWVDWVILALTAFSVFAGFMDGLVKTILSLTSLFLAFIAASRFALPFGTFLEKWVTPRVAHPAGFVIVFLLVLVLVALVTMLLRKTLEKLSLSWIDRLLGGVIGFLRAAAVLGLFALLADGFGSFSATRASKTYPYAVRCGETLLQFVPSGMKSKLQWNRSDRGAKPGTKKGDGKSDPNSGVL